MLPRCNPTSLSIHQPSPSHNLRIIYATARATTSWQSALRDIVAITPGDSYRPPQKPPHSFLTDNGPHVVQIYLLRMQHWTPSANNSQLVDSRTYCLRLVRCSLQLTKQRPDTKKNLFKFQLFRMSKKKTSALSTWQLRSRQNYRNRAAVSRNNQQIRIAQTDRTFIVRYRSIPPLLFITETPNLLGRLFISRFLLFFSTRQTKSRYDRAGCNRPVSGAGSKKRKMRQSSNRARVTEQKERSHEPTRPWQLHLQANCRRHVGLLRLYFD